MTNKCYFPKSIVPKSKFSIPELRFLCIHPLGTLCKPHKVATALRTGMAALMARAWTEADNGVIGLAVCLDARYFCVRV